jgi:site-specific recombinase XerD
MQTDPTAALAVVAQATAGIQTADDLAVTFLAGYRPATREPYARDLHRWGRFLARIGVAPLDAYRVHVEAFCREAEAEGVAPSTLARCLSTLSGFYAYAL